MQFTEFFQNFIFTFIPLSRHNTFRCNSFNMIYGFILDQLIVRLFWQIKGLELRPRNVTCTPIFVQPNKMETTL